MPYKDPEKERASKRLHYLRNKEEYIQRAKAHDGVRKARVRELLEVEKAKPCMDCGGSFPACAMDFDHVRGKKVRDISNCVVNAWSVERVKEEIAKCDLVCSNCHRIRTFRRREAARKKLS